jgi:hypothetical protein
MSQKRSFSFDALEDRKLLTAARARHLPTTPIHPTPAIVVLDGMLVVDNKTATTIVNPNGTQITSTPVVGKVGTLGTVRGVWNETVNAYGNTTGLDTLRLRDSSGTLLLAFNNQNPGSQHKTGRTSYYEDGQTLADATGAYKGTNESGTIQLITNSTVTLVDGLRLHTRTS